MAGNSSPYLEECFEVSDAGNIKRIITMQNALTTLKDPKDEQDQGFSSNYDHFTYDAERFKDVRVACDRIDSVGKYCNGDFKRHREKISDHVPIVMDLNIRGGKK